MGSNETQFHVSLIFGGKVTKTSVDKRAEAESNWGPSAYPPKVTLLGQAGSHVAPVSK